MVPEEVEETKAVVKPVLGFTKAVKKRAVLPTTLKAVYLKPSKVPGENGFVCMSSFVPSLMTHGILFDLV